MVDNRFVTGRQRSEIKRLLAERDWRNEPDESLRKATELVAGLLAASGDVTQGDTGIGFARKLSIQHEQVAGRPFLARHATSLISYLQRMPKLRTDGFCTTCKAKLNQGVVVDSRIYCDEHDPRRTAVIESTSILASDEELIAAERAPMRNDKVAWDNVKRQIEESGRKKSDGFYQLPDGRIYKVQLSQNNRLYGKRLVVHSPAVWLGGDDESVLAELVVPAEIEWVWEEGAMRHIRPEHKMTEEQATAYGKLYGRCYECGRPLRNELSTYLGIGPICGNREFGGQFKWKVYDAKIALGLKKGK